MNKFFSSFFRYIFPFLFCLSVSSSYYFEITRNNFSFLLESETHVAVVNKIQVDNNDNVFLEIPCFLSFCDGKYKVVGLAFGCIDDSLKNKITHLILPIFFDSDDKITKKELYKLLDSKTLIDDDKYVIRCFCDGIDQNSLNKNKKSNSIKKVASYF